MTGSHLGQCLGVNIANKSVWSNFLIEQNNSHNMSMTIGLLLRVAQSNAEKYDLTHELGE